MTLVPSFLLCYFCVIFLVHGDFERGLFRCEKTGAFLVVIIVQSLFLSIQWEKAEL